MSLHRTITLLIIIALSSFAISFVARIYNNKNAQASIFEQDIEKYQHLGGDFTLESITGPVRLSDLLERGTVVLYFGFTRCPDICPTSLSVLASSLELLSDEQKASIIPVMISVDPKHDTLELLDQYVRFFIPEMIGLRGSHDQIQSIANNYGAYVRQVPLPESDIGYTVDHTTRLYVITDEGIRTLFEHNKTPQEIADILSFFTE